MKAQQLSLFQQGEDLPLFQQAQEAEQAQPTKAERQDALINALYPSGQDASKWDRLSPEEQKSARRLVRIAASREALGREWSPWCINTPRVIGMTPEMIQAEWTSAARRAKHLLAVLQQAEQPEPEGQCSECGHQLVKGSCLCTEHAHREAEPEPPKFGEAERYQTPDGIGQVMATPLPTPGKAWVRFPDGTTRAYPYDQLTPAPKPEPATPTEALAAKLHEIHILRATLNKPRMTSRRHQFKGWSQRARPGAIDRWLRGLKYELAHRDAEKAAAIEAYEAKRQARVDRLHARADRAEAESQARFDTADRMASVIPMGQPILVGHHSEKRDRRYRERIHQNMRAGLDAKAEAADLRRRAEAAERNRTIFSEDPQAEEKIADKIERLTQRQEMMKAANKLVRKEDRAGLADMGFSEAVISQLFTPDFMGRLGFPDYELKNNGANIRRLKKRLASLEARPTETTETEHEDFTIVENADEYRIQIVFDDKPPANVRARLKSSGFRWAPSQGAWQRHLNNSGRWAADAFAQWYSEEVS